MGDTVSSAIDWVVDTGAEALVEFGVDEALADAIVETAVEAAVTAAVNVAVAALTAPSLGAEGRPTTVRWSPDAGVPYVMGTRATSGTRVMMDEYGADNRFLSEVRVLSGYGPGTYGTVEVNDNPLSFNGTEGTGDYAARLWRTTQPGQDTEASQLSQAGLDGGAVMSNWTSAHKISGKMAAIYTAKHNSKRDFYTNGFPKFLETITNGVLYDPRLDSTFAGGSGTHRWGTKSTYALSANGAIQALNYALGLYENGFLVEGLGLDIDEVDVQSFVECANVADLNGWTCHAAWTSKDDKKEVFKGMLQAAGARVAFKGGKLAAVSIGSQKTSIATITSADTAGPVSLKAFGSRIGRKNTITPRCVQANFDWEMIDLDPVTSETWRQEDAGPDGQPETRQTSLSLPFVTDAVQARELAAYAAANSREAMALTIPLKPYHLDLEVGDCITINEPAFNVEGLKVQILERPVDMGTGVMLLQVISETDSKHPFAQGLTTTPPTAPTLVEDNAYERVDPPVSDWSAPVAETITNPSTGGEIPVFVITGAVESPRVQWVQVQYRHRRPDGEGGFTAWSEFTPPLEYRADVTRIEVAGVPGGAEIEPRITYVTDFGATSENPLDLSAVTVAQTIADDTAQVAGRASATVTQQIDDARAELDASRDAIDSGATSLDAALASVAGKISAGSNDLDEALTTRFNLIDTTTTQLNSDIQAQVRDVRRALAKAAKTLVTFEVIEQSNRELSASVGDFSSAFSEDIQALSSDVASLVTQVNAWTAVNVSGDIASALTEEITARVDGDAALAVDIATAQTAAANAQATANNILTLNVSPASALGLRFTGLDSDVAGLTTSYNNIVTLQNIDGSAIQNLLNSLDSERDPNTPGSLRAQIDEAKQTQIADNLARVAAERRMRALVGRSVVSFEALQIAQARDTEAVYQEIARVDLAVAANTASFASILDMSVDPASAFVTRFTAAEAELDSGNAGSIAAKTANLESIVLTAGTGHVDRIAAIELDLNPGEAGSFAAKVETHESAIYDGSTGILQRLGVLEGESVDFALDISTLQQGQIDQERALAREIRRVRAQSARAVAALETQTEAQARDNEAALVLIERAQVTADGNTAGLTSILDLSADPQSALLQKLDALTVKSDTNEAGLAEVVDLTVDSGTALAQKFTSLDATDTANAQAISDASTQLSGEIAAAVQTAEQAVASESEARAREERRLRAKAARPAVMAEMAALAQDQAQEQANASIESVRSATADLDARKAEASALDALSVTLTGVQGDVATNAGNITSANASIASLNTSVANLQTGKVDVSAFNTLSSTVTSQGNRLSTAEGDISSLETITTDLETSKAEVSALDALTLTVSGVQGDVSTNTSAITSANTSITSLNSSVADLQANKVDVTTFNALSSTVTTQGQSITTIQGDISSLQTITTDLENTKAEASALDALSVTVTGQGGDIGTLQSSVANNTTAIADLNANKAEVSVVNAISAKADDNEAAVQSVTTALTDQAGSLAAFRRQVLAGGAGAFMEMGAQDSNGVYSSTFGIGARQVVIYNTIAGEYQQAVVFENGDMTLKGTLIAGGGIFYGDGSAKWPVMLEDREYALADGDVVSFGVDFGSTPDFWFDPLGLDELATGESYRLRAANATGTGFTADLKIIQQGVITPVTEAVNATTPAGPDQMVAKGSMGQAFDDAYTFQLDGTVNIQHFDEGFGSQWVGSIRIVTYFHDGSAWVEGPQRDVTYEELGITPTHTNQGQQAYAFSNYQVQVTFTGTIRQDASLGCFGVSVVSGGTATELDAVFFTFRTVAGERTASPNGETAKIIVKPRNVGA